MIRMKEFVSVDSLEEAIELNKKRTNAVIGGGLWMRLGGKKMVTGIDLSKLGLDEIIETDIDFTIGAMVSLRQVETHEGLHTYFSGICKEALKGIVGVQFRNGATVGGSVYSRFGFSDVIPLLLSVHARVRLNNEEEIPIKEYASLDKDMRIITHIIIPKENQEVFYESLRKESVDIPMLNVAVTLYPDGTLYMVVGARPQIAKLIETKLPMTEVFDTFIENIVNEYSFSSNQRASEEYRKVLANHLLNKGLHEVLARRAKNGN